MRPVKPKRTGLPAMSFRAIPRSTWSWSATPSAGSRTRRSTGRSPTSACWGRCRCRPRVRVEVRLRLRRRPARCGRRSAPRSPPPSTRWPRVPTSRSPSAMTARRDGAGAAASRCTSAVACTGVPTPAPRIYAVASGKGGVGKSPVTANLAVALADKVGVGVLDADVWGYSVPHLFGVRRAPVALKRGHAPGRGARRTAHVDGLPRRRRRAGRLARTDAAQGARAVPRRRALGRDLDVLLLDLPPGTGDITMSLLELVPDAALLAVTTPQPAARTVAERVGRMAATRGCRSPASSRTCRAWSAALRQRDGAVRLRRRAAARRRIDAPLLGQVPLDVASARRRGRRRPGGPRAGGVLRAGAASNRRRPAGRAPQPGRRTPAAQRRLVANYWVRGGPAAERSIRYSE